MTPVVRDFEQWSKIDRDKLDAPLAILLRLAFEGGHEAGIRFANQQLEPDLCEACKARLYRPESE